jgi:hypothetical protein
MEGIQQEETLDITPFKDFVLLLLSKLAKPLQVQAKAVQEIETETNKI